MVDSNNFNPFASEFDPDEPERTIKTLLAVARQSLAEGKDVEAQRQIARIIRESPDHAVQTDILVDFIESISADYPGFAASIQNVWDAYAASVKYGHWEAEKDALREEAQRARDESTGVTTITKQSAEDFLYTFEQGEKWKQVKKKIKLLHI